MNDILLGFFLLFFIGLIYVQYLFLVKKDIVKKVAHPYTEKEQYDIWMDLLRINFFLLGTIYLAFKGNVLIVCLIIIMLLPYGLSVYKKNKRKEKEEVLLTITYNKEDINRWRQLSRKKKDKRIKLIKKRSRKKIVWTNDAIYYTRRKKLNIKTELFDYLTLVNFQMEDEFITLTYGYANIPIQKFYFYVPTRHKKEVVDILNKIEKT